MPTSTHGATRSIAFPIGPEVVTVDLTRDEIVDQRFEPSFQIERAGGAIPRMAFLDERFRAVSGVVWSRASIGNMRRPERPLTLVHNPVAVVAMPEHWGVWDREFVTRSDGDR